MKKILSSILCLFLLSCFFVANVNANEIETEDAGIIDIEKETIENEINDEVTKMLAKTGASSLEELSKEEANQLVDIILEIKEDHKDYYLNNIDLKLSPNTSGASTMGDVFVTPQEQTLSYIHGHAGIGASGTGQVIEANKGVGVVLYNNRIDSYWRTKTDGGIYGVVGAAYDQYARAYQYANARIGCEYGFNALSSNDWYCSELVWYAWDSVGYNIATGRAAGQLFLPIHLEIDADLFLKEAFQ